MITDILQQILPPNYRIASIKTNKCQCGQIFWDNLNFVWQASWYGCVQSDIENNFCGDILPTI